MDYAAIRKNFEKHGFTTQLFQRKEEVNEYLAGKLNAQTIGFGGSVTLKELGLYEALRETNAVVWHNKVAAFEVRRLANCAEVYITSANAVTESGEIVNVDGTGNRVAMTAFGPKICYYFVGRIKNTPKREAAMHRARNVAAPPNAGRVGVKTPCAVKGDKCYDCNSPQRICRVTVIVERPPMGMECEIIFVDEDLGF